MNKTFLTILTLALSAGVATSAMADHHEGYGNKKGHGMFDKMDTDGDGIVTKDEHRTATDMRFDKMDADRDGAISKDEAKKAHKHMREKHKKMKEKRMEMREKHDDMDYDMDQ